MRDWKCGSARSEKAPPSHVYPPPLPPSSVLEYIHTYTYVHRILHRILYRSILGNAVTLHLFIQLRLRTYPVEFIPTYILTLEVGNSWRLSIKFT